MEFNQFLWKNYKETSSGQELYMFFKNYKKNIIEDKNPKFYQKIIQNLEYAHTSGNDFLNYVHDISDEYYLFTHDENDLPITIDIKNIDEAEEYYKSISEIQFKDEEENLCSISFESVPFLSEVLYAICPTYFFPYYFERAYQDVVEIFNTFGIFLPPVPKKNDKIGRFLHYFELCKSLYQFRIKNNLDEYDLSAFLYGFAINIIKRYTISEELPPPRKAYFVGGGKKDSTVDSSGDFYYLDDVSSDSLANWNGNPETQTGDIIVMYCLSPRSCLHSIWRAVTPGSIDPFFYFYKNINIGQPILVKNIPLKEIKNDPILGEFPLVKANMQGINGRNIPKKYYDQLLKMLKDKGQDIKILPKLTEEHIDLPILKNEKDVEKNLLEPLLIKIGYKKDDWIRQMKIRMGRGHRVYPDYAIFPHEERNNESCYWIWEAKYTIKTHKQLEEDFGQAKSYALRLKSSGLGLVSQEGVWLSTPEYDIKKIQFWSWQQINKHENLNKLFDIAGNKNK